MIVIPASLRSDFIHIAGMTIHIALESTIHIAGILTWAKSYRTTWQHMFRSRSFYECRRF